MIRTEQEGRVRRLRLAAPERHNIIDAPMSLRVVGRT